MDRSDDVNNCRSEATLVFSMMPDFIHMGQAWMQIPLCAARRCSSLERFFQTRPQRSLWFLARLTSAFLAHRFTAEFDPVRVMHQPVEDAVGDGGVANLFVPVRHRHLGSEDDRPALVSVIADLEEIAPLAVL